MHLILCIDNIGNINKTNLKKRNPGVDLIRLISSYLIMLTHFIFYGKVITKYIKYKKYIFVIHFLTDWHNNAFALISGFIGFKTNRYSNLLYLWLTVFFYSVGIHLYIQKFKKNYTIKRPISFEFFPIIFQRYWYFTSYFGMYLFLPVVNKGISNITKYELKFVVITTLGIFVLWRDFKNKYYDVFNINKGYSMIWLLILYLTGAYIGKYWVYYYGKQKFFFCFKCLFIYLFSTYLFTKVNLNEFNIGKGYFQNNLLLLLKKIFSARFDSFLKVTQSITLCLFFFQLNYNQYIAKIICFLGPLAFGVYLIHYHPIISSNYLKHVFDDSKKELSLNSVIILILFKPFKMYVFCLFIEYLRNKLFMLLKLRKACIFLEIKLKEILIYFENN